MSPEPPFKFVCLLVLDGWGIAPSSPGNAIDLARTPNIDELYSSYPSTELIASGEEVGLPRKEVGNTETGHLNLGAGKIVYQDLARINMAIADGSFFINTTLLEAVNHSKKYNSKLHLLGLVGTGGVHSSIEHLYALIQLARKEKAANLYLHLITDGRDSAPTSSMTYIKNVKNVLAKESAGKIASIMGRYWAMDRDFRWDRTSKAYFALTKGQGQLVKTPEEAIQMSYSEGKTDEFIEPALITNNEAKPLALVEDNDAVIFFNFRIDRPRQLTRLFVSERVSGVEPTTDYDPYTVEYFKKHIVPEREKVTFERGTKIKNLYFVMMTEYAKSLKDSGAQVAFPPEVVSVPLGRVISEAELRQLRVAESEKERFVTFYFNGQREIQFAKEDRIIVPSPNVTTYDKMPEMSARLITKSLLTKLEEENDYAFILVNFANADMVGHTGKIQATITACEVIDECVGKIANFVRVNGGALIVTADHGNAEEMLDKSGKSANTEHSTNPVPFIAVADQFLGNYNKLPAGILADVAPTIINLLGLTVPSDMTGRDLLEGIWK